MIPYNSSLVNVQLCRRGCSVSPSKVFNFGVLTVQFETVWVFNLGDIFNAETLIRSLNGQIILIKGNHDRFLHNAKAKNALAGVKDYDDICEKLEDGTDQRVVLCHYYIPFYNGHRWQAVHLHGHSHNSEEYLIEESIKKKLRDDGFETRSYNVGCMHWNYEPVTLDEILTKADPQKDLPLPFFPYITDILSLVFGYSISDVSLAKHLP